MAYLTHDYEKNMTKTNQFQRREEGFIFFSSWRVKAIMVGKSWMVAGHEASGPVVSAIKKWK